MSNDFTANERENESGRAAELPPVVAAYLQGPPGSEQDRAIASDALARAYDDNRWLEAGKAIHEASDGSEEGFQLWHEWAAGGGLYLGEDECRSCWSSFSADAGSTHAVAERELTPEQQYERGLENFGKSLPSHMPPLPAAKSKAGEVTSTSETGENDLVVKMPPEFTGPIDPDDLTFEAHAWPDVPPPPHDENFIDRTMAENVARMAAPKLAERYAQVYGEDHDIYLDSLSRLSQPLTILDEAMMDANESERVRNILRYGRTDVKPNPRLIQWDEVPDLPRDWLMRDWLPHGESILLAGEAKIGKTLLTQTIGTALALCRPYIGTIDRPRRVLMWAGEDKPEEMAKRQRDINRYFGIENGNRDVLSRLHVASYAKEDITLIDVNGQPTARLSELRKDISDVRPDVVILDSVARVFGGNENARHAVTQFVAAIEAAVAPATLILLAHPAKASGSEYSGSTAWEGAVRVRLFLTADENGVRTLSRRKSNYAAPGESVRLVYTDGVFVPVAMAAECSPDIVRAAMVTLAERDLPCTGSRSSPNYLPKLAEAHGLLGGTTREQFAKAMAAMVASGEIGRGKVGKYVNRTGRKGYILKEAAHK